MTAPALGSAVVYYVVFLFSTTLHEAAHALAAKLGGDLTAYHGGQVTLDPRPHVKREPFGMVVLPLVSLLFSGWPLGFASAPYDPRWALRHPRRAAWMALAGPGANLLLVALAVLVIRLGVAAGRLHPPTTVGFEQVVAAGPGGGWDGAAFFLSVVFSLNLLLATFNLIPLPPLDGSAAVPALLSRRAAGRYQEFLLRNAGLGVLGLLAAWQLFGAMFSRIFLLAVRLVYPGLGYG